MVLLLLLLLLLLLGLVRLLFVWVRLAPAAGLCLRMTLRACMCRRRCCLCTGCCCGYGHMPLSLMATLLWLLTVLVQVLLQVLVLVGRMGGRWVAVPVDGPRLRAGPANSRRGRRWSWRHQGAHPQLTRQRRGLPAG